MSSNNIAAVSAFVEGAPPGEVRTYSKGHAGVTDVATARRCYRRYITIPNIYWRSRSSPHIAPTDIKSLTVEEPSILQSVNPAFKKYNEEQLATTKLLGSSQNVSPPPTERKLDLRLNNADRSSSAPTTRSEKIDTTTPRARPRSHSTTPRRYVSVL